MTEHLVMNQGNSLVWQMGGATLSIILLAHLQFGQATTHLEVIIDDTRYCAMGGDSNHKPLHLRLNINYSFVEPQHTVITKKFLPRFKYDKSKVEKY
jgi:hypothetical protein